MENGKYQQLEELAKSISDWLNKNGNPYTKIVITQDGVKVTEDVFSSPVKEIN